MKANLHAVFLRFLKLPVSVVSKNSDLSHRWKNKAIISLARLCNWILSWCIVLKMEVEVPSVNWCGVLYSLN